MKKSSKLMAIMLCVVNVLYSEDNFDPLQFLKIDTIPRQTQDFHLLDQSYIIDSLEYARRCFPKQFSPINVDHPDNEKLMQNIPQYDYFAVGQYYVYFSTTTSPIWRVLDQKGEIKAAFYAYCSNSSPMLQNLILSASQLRYLELGGDSRPSPTAETVTVKTEEGIWKCYHKRDDRRMIILGYEKDGISVVFPNDPDGLSLTDQDAILVGFLNIFSERLNPPNHKEKIEDLLNKKKQMLETKREQELLKSNKLKPNYGFLPHFLYTQFREREKEVQEAVKTIAVPDGSAKKIIPNVNSGRCLYSWIKPLWKGASDSKVKSKTEENKYPNSTQVQLWWKEANNGQIIYIITHYQSQKEAREALIPLMFVEDFSGWADEYLTAEKLVATTRVHPGLVGDFDLTRMAQLNDAGAIIPKSNESAIYFTRGNSVVMLKSMDPTYSVLSLARRIDEELKKGIEAAQSNGKWKIESGK